MLDSGHTLEPLQQWDQNMKEKYPTDDRTLTVKERDQECGVFMRYFNCDNKKRGHHTIPQRHYPEFPVAYRIRTRKFLLTRTSLAPHQAAARDCLPAVEETKNKDTRSQPSSPSN